MSSCQGVLRQSNGRVESPAKLFARMKSKLENEALGRGCSVWSSRLNISEHLRETSVSHRSEAEAITLSPISSPTRPPDLSPCFSARNRQTTGRCLESTAVDARPDPVRHLSCFTESNRTRDVSDGFGGRSLSDGSSPLQLRTTTKRKLDVDGTLVSSGAGPRTREEHKRGRVLEEKQPESPGSIQQQQQQRLIQMCPVKALAYLRQKDSRTRHTCSSETVRVLDTGCDTPARGSSPTTTRYNVRTSHTSASDDESQIQRSVPTKSPPESAKEPPLVVLIQDPLLVNSPKLLIPTKTKAPARKEWSPRKTFPSQESEICLTKWHPRRNPKGLFVDGLRRDDNIPWNSNIIVERVSSSVVKTVSGRVYILMGKMLIDRKSEFPKWFLKKFSSGFPRDWKGLLDKFLSGLKDSDCERPEKKTQPRVSKSSKDVVPEKPVRQRRTAKSLDSGTPSSTSTFSRSGRTLRPPLEYWKGGRVSLDAQMNVTIYACYDSSISKPSTTSSPETSQGSSQGENENKPRDSAGEFGASILRKAKVPLRRRQKAISPPADKPVTRRSRTRDDPQSQSDPENPTKRPARIAKKAPSKQRTPQKEHSQSQSECSSEEEWVVKRKRPAGRAGKINPDTSPPQKKNNEKKPKGKKGNTDEPQTKRLPKKNKTPPQLDSEVWTKAEVLKLKQGVASFPKHVAGYWDKVAGVVKKRSAEECHDKYTLMTQSTASKPNRRQKEKEKVETAKDCAQPIITARLGTFQRKQQVRKFLENMPTEDMDDVFSSEAMNAKKFELPLCQTTDWDMSLNDLQATTPKSSGYLEEKTPQCLHLTPGMLGSPSRIQDDKYVFQLQKRMKKNQFNVQRPSAKNFTPSPSVKRQMRKCPNTENDTFVVWELFPEKDGAPADSSEEDDYYFSEND